MTTSRMGSISWPLAGLCAVLLAAPAAAQMSNLPPEVGQAIKGYGRVVNPPQVHALYAPFQDKEPYAGVTVTRDVKYGPADRHLADIFTPSSGIGPSPRPVLIFVHGGGFTRGDRHAGPGSPYYDNIAVWAVRHGFIGVNITYRLAPQFQWPAGAEDLARAVQWVGINIGIRGGDPKRVFLMGHSAGAAHVASYLGHKEVWWGGGIGLAGGIIVSGLFDFTSMPMGEPEKAYFGTDAATYAERSSLKGLVALDLPLLVAYAEYDPPFFVEQAKELNAALCKAGKCPRFLALAGHSHMSEIDSIGTKDVELSDAMADFIRKAP